MRVLTVDTSTDIITIGLYNNGVKVYFKGEPGCKKHNSTLMRYIDDILSSNALSVSDIDYLGVCIGPGSFTGIRIGVSAINAIALAGNKKVIEVTSLEVEDDRKDKLVLLDCGHGNYYGAIFGAKQEYIAINSDEIEKIKLDKIYITASSPEKMLDKVIEKISVKHFVEQAKPFYVKKSSAER